MLPAGWSPCRAERRGLFVGLGSTFQIWEPAAAERRRAEARERAAPAASPCRRQRRRSERAHDRPYPRHAAPRCWRSSRRATAASISTARSAAAAMPRRSSRRRACTLWAIDRDPDAIARGAGAGRALSRPAASAAGSFGEMLTLLARRRASTGSTAWCSISAFRRSSSTIPRAASASAATGRSTCAWDRRGRPPPTWSTRCRNGELADTLFEFGEERLSRRIARAIVAARAERADHHHGAARRRSSARVVPPDRSGIDPATRSFQALRIRVNDELGEIERALAQAADLLAPGGRLVVVAFHSLEDRLVKRFMTEAAGRAPAPSRHDPRGLPARPAPRFRLLTRAAAAPGRAPRPPPIRAPAAPGCARDRNACGSDGAAP